VKAEILRAPCPLETDIADPAPPIANGERLIGPDGAAMKARAPPCSRWGAQTKIAIDEQYFLT
jgi:hypothetical protein